MMLSITLAFISLITLIILHEFGHFLLAKLFGVKVEEFGIGYPPRIWGKKIGQTIYSFNLLPFGAFVRIPGETEAIEDPHSFSAQPLFKRVLITLGGVLSFWIISAVIFSIVFTLGVRLAVEDTTNSYLIDPKVQIAALSANSPAANAGLRVGDVIKKIEAKGQQWEVNKIKEVQKIAEEYKGEEIILTIEREKEIFEVKLIPRVSPPKNEGPIGVALVRTAIRKYPYYLAPTEGIKATFHFTKVIIEGYFQAIKNLVKRTPAGIQLVGPVGTFHLLIQASEMGLNYFLNFLGLISIYLALFNLFPIPAVDGGKLLFLGIEFLRKKPVPMEIEQKITAFCFSLLIILAILVTIRDIARIF